MNFNLVSPNNNAHEFTVRYQEPIVIPANSSVYLNWATFERDNVVVFTQDQTFTYVLDEPIPRFTEDEVDLKGYKQTYTIKKGRYTISQLQDEILIQQIDIDGKVICGFNPTARNISLFGDDPVAGGYVGVIEPDDPVLNLNPYQLVTPNQDTNADYLTFGFNITNRLNDSNSPSTQHHKNATVHRGQGNNLANPAYVASADGTLDANNRTQYGNSYTLYDEEKYIHIGKDLNTYTTTSSQDANFRVNDGRGTDELKHANRIVALCNKTVQNIEGKIWIGLYSLEAAENVIDTEMTNPTGGANMTVRDAGTADEFPYGFGGVEVTSTGIKIFGGFFDDWASADVTKKIYEVRWADLNMNPNYFPKVFIQTYYPDTDVITNDTGADDDSESLFVRVGLINNGNMTVIIYDSNWYETNFDWIFTKDFLTEFSSVVPPSQHQQGGGVGEASRRAELPFNPMVAATKTNEGWIDIAYSVVDERNVGPEKSMTLVRKYHLELSKELGNLFTPSKDSTIVLDQRFPTTSNIVNLKAFVGGNFLNVNNNTNQFFYQFNQLIHQYRLDKFIVLINGLPIKAYSNKANFGGTRKTILANIPNPFAGGDVIGGTGDYNERIIGSYQSSMGIVNQLNNQQFTTNNFSIKIVNMEDETPAEQLDKVVINFTITVNQ